MEKTSPTGVENISLKNVQKLCRACLKELKPRNKYRITSLNISMQKWLDDVAAKKPQYIFLNNYPNSICKCCRDKIYRILKFREVCIKSVEKIHKLLAGNDGKELKKNYLKNNFKSKSDGYNHVSAQATETEVEREESMILGQEDKTTSQYDVFKDEIYKLNYNIGQPKEKYDNVKANLFYKMFSSQLLSSTDKSKLIVEENSNDSEKKTSDSARRDEVRKNIKAFKNNCWVRDDENKIYSDDCEDCILPMQEHKTRNQYILKAMKTKQFNVCDELPMEKEVNLQDANLFYKMFSSHHLSRADKYNSKMIVEKICNDDMFDSKQMQSDSESDYNSDYDNNINLKSEKQDKAHGIHKYPFRCELCGTINLSQKFLDMHMRVHRNLLQYQCSKCEDSFSSSAHLRDHFKDVHNETNLKIICEIPECGVELKNIGSYKRHYISFHLPSTSSRYKCEKCGMIYKSAKLLKDHLFRHGPKELYPYKCDKCDKTFISLQTFKDHKLRHAGIKNFECTECGVKKTTSKELHMHILVNHKKNQSEHENDSDFEHNDSIKSNDKKVKRPQKAYPFRCEQCGTRCMSQKMLDIHMRIHSGLLQYQCPKCDDSFKNPLNLNKHFKEIHNETNFNIICEYEGCGLKFATIITYKKHYLMFHLTVLANKHMCEECGKSYCTAKLLQNHIYTHGPKELYPYPCDQCDKAYIHPHTLEEHKLRHAGIKNFVCPQCGIKKTTSHELKFHMNIHTKKLKYPCPYCSRISYSSTCRRRHINTVHKGIRNYCCRYCDKKFCSNTNLVKHERLHTGERPYACVHCSKRFVQKVSMELHVKNNHKSVS